MNAPGTCACRPGCQAVTKIATHSRGSSVRGEYNKFAAGHHMRTSAYDISGERNPNWRGDDVSYGGLHRYVGRHKPKTGTCAHCRKFIGFTKRRHTEWANVSGDYLRDLSDWLELCRPCHDEFDYARKYAKVEPVVAPRARRRSRSHQQRRLALA